MASGTVVSEGGDKEGVGGKQRHVEIKVYTRKAFRKPKKDIVNDKKDDNNIDRTGNDTETNGDSTTNATTDSSKPFASTIAANSDNNESKKNREADRVNNEGGCASIDTIAASGDDIQKVKENGSKESLINGISDRLDNGEDHQESDRNMGTTAPSTAVVTAAVDTSGQGDDDWEIVERDDSLIRSGEPDSQQTGALEKGNFVQEESTIPVSTIVSTVDTTAGDVEGMDTDNHRVNNLIEVVELDSQQTGTLEKASSLQEEPTTISATMITTDIDAVTKGDMGNNFDKQHGNDIIQVVELDSEQTDTLEKEYPVQEGPASHLDANSNDSSGLHRQQVMSEEFPSAPGAPLIADGSGPVKQRVQSGVKMNLASKSKQEKRELRRKLEDELLIVRGLVKKIEAKEGQLVSGFNNSRAPVNFVVDNELRRVNSDVGSVGITRESVILTPTPAPRQSRPFNQLSVSLLENGRSGNEHVEKEKRTPKENQFYSHSEFFLAKDKFRPTENNKKSKSNSKKQGGVEMGRFGTGTKIFKSCSALLEKLMKHKHGWVFNNPVDVKGLGLHDYFTIIKHPMDLGTIKSRLNKNWYKTPEEFAEDVRLTFHNAMRYNPKGQDVHIMAEMLLTIFEDKWAVIKLEYDREMRFAASYDMGVPTPTSRKAPPPFRPPPLDMRRILDRSESMTYAPVNPPVSARPKPITTTPSSRTPAPKKPKAKDPNKRDMTYDEKQKLSANLQNLPSEKLDNIVQIVKKRNSALFQHDDEIEVDIDSVDTETLWELDRFVTNYKKNLSKHKRKAELALQGRVEKEQKIQEQTIVQVLNDAPLHTTTDERNITSTPPVQLDKQGGNGSRSSSSSSSSSDSGSSSSDSDSDSSSDSES